MSKNLQCKLGLFSGVVACRKTLVKNTGFLILYIVNKPLYCMIRVLCRELFHCNGRSTIKTISLIVKDRNTPSMNFLERRSSEVKKWCAIDFL